jgi:hypothetical protein
MGYVEHDGNGTEYKGPYSCTFRNDAVKEISWPESGPVRGCYEYDEGVSKEEALAECREHRLGSVIMVSELTFVEGACDTKGFSGYCIDLDQPVLGKEYSGPNKYFVDNLVDDCDVTNIDEFSNAAACEDFAAGTYTCIVD